MGDYCLAGGCLPPSARFEIVAGSEGGNSGRRREMESRSYPITLKTIVLSAHGGPFWATPDPVPLMLFHEGFPFSFKLRYARDDAYV